MIRGCLIYSHLKKTATILINVILLLLHNSGILSQENPKLNLGELVEILTLQPLEGKHIFTLNDNTICELNFKNGLLEGKAQFFYPDKKLKARGKFQTNSFYGRWKFYGEKKFHKGIKTFDNKAVKIKKVRIGILHYPVIYGKGEIHYTIKQADTSENYSGKIKISKGLKNGFVKETYPTKTFRRNASMVKGKYDGVYEQYFSNGKIQIRAFFKNGVPQNEFTEYSSEGEIVRKADYSKSPPRYKIAGSYYLGHYDNLFSTYVLRAYPLNKPMNKIFFEKDSNNLNLFHVLNQIFEEGHYVFYNNVNLDSIILPRPMRPNITLLTYTTEVKPLMLLTVEQYYYSYQNSTLRKNIYCLSILFSYKNRNGFLEYKLTPWAYFPELYNISPNYVLHNKELQYWFDKLVNDCFFSLTLNKTTNYDEVLNFSTENLQNLVFTNLIEIYNNVINVTLEESGIK